MYILVTLLTKPPPAEAEGRHHGRSGAAPRQAPGRGLAGGQSGRAGEAAAARAGGGPAQA